MPELDIFQQTANLACQEVHLFSDATTQLQAVIAIHNTMRGPALGGCRWLEYDHSNLAIEDAMRLARSMSLKSALAGLPLGGGKAVLIKPTTPMSPAAKQAYFACFAAKLNQLNGRYITAEDSGTSVSEMDLIAKHSRYVTGTSQFRYQHADPSIYTALGVYYGMQAALAFTGQRTTLKGLRVLIQGLGHVGLALAKLLHQTGAHLSVYDVVPEKMQYCQQQFAATTLPHQEAVWSHPCDIFAPCALGGVLNSSTISQLQAPIVAGAANNQLSKHTDAELLQARAILYAPDFAINAGGIITVANEYCQLSEAANHQQLQRIAETLTHIFQLAASSKKSTHQLATELALQRLQAPIQEPITAYA
jgi:leucine dehydrogenase